MIQEFQRGDSFPLVSVFSIFGPLNFVFFGIAAGIVDRIAVGQAEWSELFQPHDFFTRYRYYLQIIASSGSAELQLKWYVPPHYLDFVPCSAEDARMLLFFACRLLQVRDSAVQGPDACF
jgi:hypothetical protein